MTRQLRPLLGFALVGLVAAAGCSGDDNDAGSDDLTVGADTTSTSATAPPSAPTTAAPSSTATSTTTTSTTTTSTTTATPSTEPPAPAVRLNEVQMIGSHNSYHLAPEGPLMEALEALAPDFAADLDYTHRTLTEQLELFGIRQFEIDVHADPEGGHYSNRAALPLVGLPAESDIAELDEPGYKVFHIQDFDFRSTCLTLRACLAEIEAWSTAHPTHVPIHIMIEVKAESIEEIAEGADFVLPDLGVTWTAPIPTTIELLTDLEDEVLAVFDRERLITPDDVRGDSETLSEAVVVNGWPTLDESRGKVMLSLLDPGPATDLYREGAPALEGRLLFTHADPGDPDAAIVRLDDPINDADAIREALASGYLVRTRSDDDDTPDGDTSRRDAALAIGAQYVSTDVYEDVGRGFVVTLPGDAVVRCNPSTRSAVCDDTTLGE